MNVLTTITCAAAVLALAGTAQADTRNSNGDKGVMEQKASPSAAKSDEERAEASQGQPNVPNASGSTSASGGASTKAGKEKRHGAKPKVKAPGKESPSSGSSAPSSSAADPKHDADFKQADVDGDGAVSKAEAAGNEPLVKGFDRADRNHDGKLNRAEYESVFRSKPKSPAQAAR